MDVVKPRWSSASFLVYAGVLTVGSAATYALVYLAIEYGDAAYAGWAALITAALVAIATAARRRNRLVAGVFAFVSVGAFIGFVAALWLWFGWGVGNAPFGGFDVSRLGAVLLILLFAVAQAGRFRHPLLAFPVVLLSWFFVTDLISNGGSWTAVVTLVIGLVLLAAGMAIDRGARRPYGFWVQAGAGLAIGGPLLYWWHSGDFRWALIAVGGLVYVWLATTTGRSSWAVLGAWGLAAAATHFASEWSSGATSVIGTSVPLPGATSTYQPSLSFGNPRFWVPPLVFAFLGFLFVALAAYVSRRERRSPRPSAE
jgi:hypothetical protein